MSNTQAERAAALGISQPALAKRERKAREAACADLDYRVGDVLAQLAQIPDESVAGCIYSPPYNKSFRGRKGESSNWKRAGGRLYAGYDGHADDMEPAAYTEWQRQVLAECLRVTVSGGVVWLNIAPAYRREGMDTRAAIVDRFVVREVVLWNRGSTHQQDWSYPFGSGHYEYLFMLPKGNYRTPAVLRETANAEGWYSPVWKIRPSSGEEHEATFPEEIPRRCILAMPPFGPVLDPFAGSGTTLIAARRLGRPAIGIELSAKYKRLAEEKWAALGREMAAAGRQTRF